MVPIIADESRIVHGITVWPMIRWRAGTVTAVARQWTGVREVVVDVVGDGLTPPWPMSGWSAPRSRATGSC